MEEYWEFLLQKEGDHSWLPLESSDVEILEGRYRIVAHSNRLNTPVETLITHLNYAEMPPKRRRQQRPGQTNQDGLMVIMPFTWLQPGIWEIQCASDLRRGSADWQYGIQLQVLSQDTESAENWDAPVYSISPEPSTGSPPSPLSDSDRRPPIPAPPAASGLPDSEISYPFPSTTTHGTPSGLQPRSPASDALLPEEGVSHPLTANSRSETASSFVDPEADLMAEQAAERATQISQEVMASIFGEPLAAESSHSAFASESPAQATDPVPERQQDAAQPRGDSSATLNLSLNLTLTQEDYVIGQGQPIILEGRLSGQAIATDPKEAQSVTHQLGTEPVGTDSHPNNTATTEEEDVVIPVACELRIRLLNPQTSEVLTCIQEPLPHQPLPFSFTSRLDIPTGVNTHLLLGDVALLTSTDETEAHLLTTRSFSVTADIQQLLGAIADPADPTGFFAATDDPDEAAQQAQPDLNLSLFNLVSAPKEVGNLQPSLGIQLPPQIHHLADTDEDGTPPELPPMLETQFSPAAREQNTGDETSVIPPRPLDLPPISLKVDELGPLPTALSNPAVTDPTQQGLQLPILPLSPSTLPQPEGDRSAPLRIVFYRSESPVLDGTPREGADHIGELEPDALDARLQRLAERSSSQSDTVQVPERVDEPHDTSADLPEPRGPKLWQLAAPAMEPAEDNSSLPEQSSTDSPVLSDESSSQGEDAEDAVEDSDPLETEAPLDQAFQSLDLQTRFLSRLNTLAADAELLQELEMAAEPSLPDALSDNPVDEQAVSSQRETDASELESEPKAVEGEVTDVLADAGTSELTEDREPDESRADMEAAPERSAIAVPDHGVSDNEVALDDAIAPDALDEIAVESVDLDDPDLEQLDPASLGLDSDGLAPEHMGDVNQDGVNPDLALPDDMSGNLLGSDFLPEKLLLPDVGFPESPDSSATTSPHVEELLPEALVAPQAEDPENASAGSNLDQEVVIYDDEPMAGAPELGGTQARPTPSWPSSPIEDGDPELDHPMLIPTPTIDIPKKELVAGTPVEIRVQLPDSALTQILDFYVKLWVSDLQTRMLLGTPQQLRNFVPDGHGNLEATTLIDIPLSVLELQFEAITVQPATQRESHKAIVHRAVVAADVPDLSLKEFDIGM